MKLLLLISFPSLYLAFVSYTTHPLHLLSVHTQEEGLSLSADNHSSPLLHSIAQSQPQIRSSLVAKNKFSAPVIGILTRCFDMFLDAIVTILSVPIALILAKIINHPSVREALGQCIVSGIKQLCIDPELDDYVDRAGAILNQDLHKDARDAGEEFPILVKNFRVGFIQSFGRGGKSRPTKA
ncbi:hypothetical protein MHU86_2933 [Fragilaria crotonensis]|nr:hypothetical protein MHU86_2933 [Fragilaria crotonensis]